MTEPLCHLLLMLIGRLINLVYLDGECYSYHSTADTSLHYDTLLQVLKLPGLLQCNQTDCALLEVMKEQVGCRLP